MEKVDFHVDDEERLHLSSSSDLISVSSYEYEEEVIGMPLTGDPRSKILMLELQRLLLTEGEIQLSFDPKLRKVVKEVVVVQEEGQRENLKISAYCGSKERTHPRVTQKKVQGGEIPKHTP